MLRRTISAGCFALAMMPAMAEAQVIYSNGAPGSLGLANEMTHFIQAEHFSLTSTFLVTGFSYWSANASVYSGSTTWQVYANTGGAPGTVLFSGGSTVAGVSDPIAAPVSLTRYDVPTNFVLPAGDYYLGLHNGPLTSTTNVGFGWQGTDDLSAALTGVANEAPFADNSFSEQTFVEHALVLTGQTQSIVSVVPEPATYLLLGTGLFLTGFVRRRRV